MAGNDYCEDMPDCPLCMEPFGLDDINFFPCACRYQVCRFCWHRIRTDENGLCPHCREPYTENPAEYTPPTQEQISKLKSEKKQKSTERKQKLVENRKNLADVRVIQRNLVFVVGLSPRLADPETLRKNEYFGKYGRIFKVVINNHTVYNGTQGPSVSAYVTFIRDDDALKAISAVNNAYIDGRYLKASFGTTKYCTTFLRGTQCSKPDCMYLHALGDNEASFTKEDMHLGKHQVYEQSALAAANLEPKDVAIESLPPTYNSTPAVAVPVVKKVQPVTVVSRSPIVIDTGESSALPSTASWATSVPKPAEAAVHHAPHSKSHSKSSKPRSMQHHSPSVHRHGLKHKENNSTSGSPSPNMIAMEREISSGNKAQRTNSTSSSSSGDSYSLSPKSTISKSLSSGSLNQFSTFDSPESVSRLKSNCVEAIVNGGLAVSESVNTDQIMSESDMIDEDLNEEIAALSVCEPSVMSEVDAAIQPKPVTMLEQELAREAEMALPDTQTEVSVPLTSTGVLAVNLPCSEYKVVERGVANQGVVPKHVGGDKSDVLNVLSGLGSNGSDHFGSLGVSWNTQVPSTLTSKSEAASREESKVTSSQHDDDLGFDPWDVSQQGLADLLETEAEEQRRPPSKPLTNGVREHSFSALPNRTASKGHHDPWQDEFRALFPDVNVSFGGGPGFPSTATKAKSDKPSSSLHHALNATHTTPAYHPTQLANALNYSYNPSAGATPPATTGASSMSGFPVRGFPASCTKVVSSDCGLPGSGRGFSDGNWPGFGDLGTSVDGRKTVKDTELKNTVISSTTSTPHTAYTSSLPSPPPGFVAKPAFATTSVTSATRPAVTKVATPTTVHGAVGGGTLSSSVNHALWANSQMQGKAAPLTAGHAVPNHLLQSWNNFLNFSALTPAQQQQLARSSQNYQHLLAQQYLLMQSLLMRGYPMLQAQAQAQAQIQASIRAQLHQHALRQQQQQQQQQHAGMAVGTSVSSPATLPKTVPMSVPIAKPTQTSVVSTISTTNNVVSASVQATSSSPPPNATSTSSKGATQSSKSSNQSVSTSKPKHGPTNSKNHIHHAASSKNKTSSTSSKPAKSSSAVNSERRPRQKNAGK